MIRFPAGSFPTMFRVHIKTMATDEANALPDAKRRVSRIYDITKSASGIFLKPVTVTLAFDSARLNPDTDKVAVYWFNELTREWVRLNAAVVDWKRGTVSGETIHFTKFAVLTAPGELPSGELLPEFSDIVGHWAEESIRMLVGRGYVNGYPDGTFRPNRQVTRAEFVQLLTRVFELKSAGMDGNAGEFEDTSGHWAREAIAAASAAGIVDGYDRRRFGADDPITREQMTTMLVRALGLTLTPGDAAGSRFADRAAIAGWALSSVATATEQGLFRGYEDGTFRPQAHATRAETVQALMRAIALRDRD